MKAIRTRFALDFNLQRLPLQAILDKQVQVAAPWLGQDVDVSIAVNVCRDRPVRLQAALYDFENDAPAAEFVREWSPNADAARAVSSRCRSGNSDCR